MCVSSQVVYKLESETQGKMRSKGLQEGKVSGPEAEASADRWMLFVEAERPNIAATSRGDGPQTTLRGTEGHSISDRDGGGDVSTQLL